MEFIRNEVRFPWSQNRDLHTTDEDLSVGSPDLGRPALVAVQAVRELGRLLLQIVFRAQPILFGESVLVATLRPILPR